MELTDPILRQYQRYLGVKGIKKVSQDKYQYAAARFQRWLDEHGLTAAEVDMLTMMEYGNGHGPLNDLAEGTKRAHLVQLRAAFAFALDEGVIEKTPFTRRFVMPRKSDPEHTTLPIEKLRHCRNTCQDWRQSLLLALLMYTGMRRDEIRRLEWSNVDLDAGTLTFVGKQSKKRVVPIHDELRAILEDVPYPMTQANLVRKVRGAEPIAEGPVLHSSSGKMYSLTGLRHLLSLVVDEDISFHVFRRSFATSLDRNGVSGTVRDKVMGWAAQSMFARSYDGLTIDDLAEGVEQLYMKETDGAGI